MYCYSCARDSVFQFFGQTSQYYSELRNTAINYKEGLIVNNCKNCFRTVTYEKTIDDKLTEVELNKCDCCKSFKSNVEETIDPYLKEVYNEEIISFLCEDCYQNICEDI